MIAARLAEMRGHAWAPASTEMRACLADVATAGKRSPQPSPPTPVCIAANGCEPLELAAHASYGADTFIRPTQRSRRAGPILGPQKAPNVALRCFLCRDAEAGRRAARNRLSTHVQHEVCPQQCAEFGPGPSEQAHGGGDRFGRACQTSTRREAV